MRSNTLDDLPLRPRPIIIGIASNNVMAQESYRAVDLAYMHAATPRIRTDLLVILGDALALCRYGSRMH